MRSRNAEESGVLARRAPTMMREAAKRDKEKDMLKAFIVLRFMRENVAGSELVELMGYLPQGLKKY